MNKRLNIILIISTYICTISLVGLGIYLIITKNIEYSGFQAKIIEIYTTGQKIRIVGYSETTCLQYSCSVVHFTNTEGYTGQCYIFQADRPDFPIPNYNVTLYRTGWYIEHQQPICFTDSHTERTGRLAGGIMLIVFMVAILTFTTISMDRLCPSDLKKNISSGEGSPLNHAARSSTDVLACVSDVERGNTNEGN